MRVSLVQKISTSDLTTYVLNDASTFGLGQVRCSVEIPPTDAKWIPEFDQLLLSANPWPVVDVHLKLTSVDSHARDLVGDVLRLTWATRVRTSWL